MKTGSLFCWVLLIMLFQSTSGLSQVIFNEAPEIKTMIEGQIAINSSPTNKFEVWRIQIVATTERRKLEAIRADFSRKYNWLKHSTDFSDPYYKLQVGAYTQRLHAEAVLFDLKRDYPGAYLVRDKVPLSELTE
jgi:hypothetical protein